MRSRGFWKWVLGTGLVAVAVGIGWWAETRFGPQNTLVLRQVLTGDEPEIVSFRVPLPYDELEEMGSLRLLVDGDGRMASLQDCSRGRDGACVLHWNTSFDPPGQHSLQAHLLLWKDRPKRRSKSILGPQLAFRVPNAFQFFTFFANYDSQGAILYARTSETNALCRLSIRNLQGERIRSLAGVASNGIIDVRWDLKDDLGRLYTNEEFECIFESPHGLSNVARYTREPH